MFKDEVLITGATGFLGKHFLFRVLTDQAGPKKIHLLVRRSKNVGARERIDEIFKTERLFESLSDAQKAMVHVHEGDCSKENFDLSEEYLNKHFSSLSLIVNCAADVSFWQKKEEAFQSNCVSMFYLTSFLKKKDFQHIQLLHVSTCYVSGLRSGHLDENFYFKKNLFKNLGLVELYQSALSLFNEHPNSYTWSKCVSEGILSQNLSSERWAIVRPSIIEASYSFPYGGWMQGVKTAAPLCYLALKSSKLYGNPSAILDIVPVDFVSKSLVLCATLLLQKRHKPIYQCCTSGVNPIRLSALCRFTNLWKRENHYILREEKNLSDNIAYHFGESRFIGRLYYPVFVVKIVQCLFSLIKSVSSRKKAALSYLLVSQKIYKTYKPFIAGPQRYYASRVLEEEFAFMDLKNIDWKVYWTRSQMPAVHNAFQKNFHQYMQQNKRVDKMLSRQTFIKWDCETLGVGVHVHAE